MARPRLRIVVRMCIGFGIAAACGLMVAAIADTAVMGAVIGWGCGCVAGAIIAREPD